jgi:sialate O-acetylesterase
MLKKFCLFLIVSLTALSCFSAELTLPSIFSDHLVLQRERPVPVWGQAAPGATITVEFAGQTKTTVASDNGKWQVMLDPMPASAEPRELNISSNLKSKIVDQKFSNVLVGDVWLCSGQSNMQWAMTRTENGEAAIAAADHPQIRLYHTPAVFAREPQERINATWTVCTPETVKGFSGVAYYFGRKLNQELDVPIGLLHSSWGGTRIEPWTPPCGFEGIDSLADILQKINPMPALDGDAKQERQFPTAIYNGMIHAHIPFAIRGAIWYQGEANRTEGMLYVDKTRALLNGWRGLWGYDFPFYFVQIAPFQYGNQEPNVLAEFWEAQAEIVKQIPNTGMAVVSDATTLDDIHPPNKEVPGTRLALLALDNTYGMDVVSTGPTFKALKKPLLRSGRLTISFDSAAGLTTRDGNDPDWFEIAGEDGVFKPATAVIKKTAVIVSSPDVPKPVAVRFAWHKLATPNLVNGAGLPAPAFRTVIRN